MVYLYGTSERDRLLKSGAFRCPNCRKNRYCTNRIIESWFSLFFVPLYRLDIITEYSKCLDCRHSFKGPGMVPFLPRGGYLASDLKVELRSGASIEGVEGRLVDSGVDRETAQSVIRGMVGDRLQFCQPCRLTYQMDVVACWECRRPLSEGKTKISPDLDDLI